MTQLFRESSLRTNIAFCSAITKFLAVNENADGRNVVDICAVLIDLLILAQIESPNSLLAFQCQSVKQLYYQNVKMLMKSFFRF